jgi:peptidoglycan/xylan/chitin deacetylase (PgdA/CDA1 family)
MPKNKLIVFNYHQSTPNFEQQRNGQYIWSETGFFEQEIKYLNEKFRIVHLMDGMKILREGRMKGTMVSLTFDDGDISVSRYIVPILEKYKIPATFFINSAYLSGDNKGYWFNIFNYLKYGNKDQQGLITDEIAEIAANLRNTTDANYYQSQYQKVEQLGKYVDKNFTFYIDHDFLRNLNKDLFTIGLHGHEHQRFSMMPIDWQRKNIQTNIDLLSGYSAYQSVFAVPFGKPHDWNNDTINICKEFRLEFAFSNGGYNTRHSQGILRIPVDGIKVSKVLSKLSPFLKPDYILK